MTPASASNTMLAHDHIAELFRAEPIA